MTLDRIPLGTGERRVAARPHHRDEACRKPDRAVPPATRPPADVLDKVSEVVARPRRRNPGDVLEIEQEMVVEPVQQVPVLALRLTSSRVHVVVVEGMVSEDDYTGGVKMRADSVQPLFEARQAMLKGLLIDWRGQGHGQGGLDSLSSILERYRGGTCPLKIRYSRADAEGEVRLSDDWAVKPEDELLHLLRDAYGEDHLAMEY